MSWTPPDRRAGRCNGPSCWGEISVTCSACGESSCVKRCWTLPTPPATSGWRHACWKRWLACRQAPNAPEAWLHLSALYRQLDELEAAARALAKAAHAQADPAEVLASVDAFGEVPSR